MRINASKTKFIIKKIKSDSDLVYSIGKNAHLDLVLIFSGQRNITASVQVELTGIQASAQILCFTNNNKNRKTHLLTTQLHDAPKTKSNLLVKSLVCGKSYVNYDGRIIVSKKAHLTDAYQRNENLLIYPEARAVSKPKLEILANDVRCTHGSSTGGLDQEALWYLSSRGIGKAKAQKLLKNGFFESAISRISDTMNQDKVRRFLWQIM